MLLRILITASVFFITIRPAEAQVNRVPYGVKSKPGSAQQALTQYEGTGTIAAIEPGRILMVTTAKENCLVLIFPQTKIITTGEVRRGFLQSGLLVEFRAELDKQGNVTNTIEQLTLITPSAEKNPGIFPPSGNKADLTGNQTAPVGPCTVIGRISAFHNDTLQINVGRGTLLAGLSNNAKIRLVVTDYSMARKGDKITVSGMKMRSGANQVQAAQVHIELAEALAGMTTKSLPINAPTPRTPKSTKFKQPAGLPIKAEEQ